MAACQGCWSWRWPRKAGRIVMVNMAITRSMGSMSSTMQMVSIAGMPRVVNTLSMVSMVSMVSIASVASVLSVANRVAVNDQRLPVAANGRNHAETGHAALARAEKASGQMRAGRRRRRWAAVQGRVVHRGGCNAGRCRSLQPVEGPAH